MSRETGPHENNKSPNRPLDMMICDCVAVGVVGGGGSRGQEGQTNDGRKSAKLEEFSERKKKQIESKAHEWSDMSCSRQSKDTARKQINGGMREKRAEGMEGWKNAWCVREKKQTWR